MNDKHLLGDTLIAIGGAVLIIAPIVYFIS